MSSYYTMEEVLDMGLEVVGPDDEPYGDIEIRTEDTGSLVCTIPQDDAPVHDYNDRQYKFANLFAASPSLVKTLQSAHRKLISGDFENLPDEIAAALAKAGVCQ